MAEKQGYLRYGGQNYPLSANISSGASDHEFQTYYYTYTGTNKFALPVGVGKTIKKIIGYNVNGQMDNEQDDWALNGNEITLNYANFVNGNKGIIYYITG